MVLSHIGDHLRRLLVVPGISVFAIDHDPAASLGDQSQKGLEKRGFPDAVWPQYGKDLFLIELEIDMVEDRPAGIVSAGQFLYSHQHYSHPLLR